MNKYYDKAGLKMAARIEAHMSIGLPISYKELSDLSNHVQRDRDLFMESWGRFFDNSGYIDDPVLFVYRKGSIKR